MNVGHSKAQNPAWTCFKKRRENFHALCHVHMRTKVESEGEEEPLGDFLAKEDPEPPEPSLDAPDGPPSDSSSSHCSADDGGRNSYHELKQPPDESHAPAGINMEEPLNSFPFEFTPTQDSFLTLEYVQVRCPAMAALT